jgi:hypothetical protein
VRWGVGPQLAEMGVEEVLEGERREAAWQWGAGGGGEFCDDWRRRDGGGGGVVEWVGGKLSVPVGGERYREGCIGGLKCDGSVLNVVI